MWRFLFNLALSLSILALLAASAGWVKSYRKAEMIEGRLDPRPHSKYPKATAVSRLRMEHFEGRLHIAYIRESCAPAIYNPELCEWKSWRYFAADGDGYATLVFKPPSNAVMGFFYHSDRSKTEWWVPYGAIVGLFSFLPAWGLMRVFVGRRTKVEGICCKTCGYDLRASPERCPECGMMVQSSPDRGRGASPGMV